MRAESLWVVGSYARGALTCGDLDLVLKLERIDGVHADVSRFASKAFPRARDVRYYGGDPQENTSGVTFPEAVHIWSPGMNWRSAIESIALNPDAGRFTRPTDEFPLRAEQLHAEFDDIEELLKRRAAGEISWRFLPVNPKDPVRSGAEEWETTVARYMSRTGENTRKLVPHVLACLRAHGEQLHSRVSNGSTSTELLVEGTLICMGRPRLNDNLLDTTDISRVLLFPHFSRRGPNGILELRRGANHLLVIRSGKLSAYVLRAEGGSLVRECYVTRLRSECELIAFFSTAEQARQYAADELQAKEPPLQPCLIEGTELLDTLSYADAIDVHKPSGNIAPLVLTHMGRVVFADEDESVQIASTDQVFDVLAEASIRS